MSQLLPSLLPALLASFVCVGGVLADDAVAAEPRISVTVVVILAGEEKGPIDPQLAGIAEEIRKQNPQLARFRLKSMTRRSLPENERSEFDLVEDKKVDVTIKHGPDSDNKITVSLTPTGQGDIEYRTVPGKFLPIVTRHQTKDRQRIIFAVRVDVEK